MSKLCTVMVVLAVAAPGYAEAVDPAILAAVKKIKPTDYPSANTLAIVNDQAVVYQPDGQFTNTAHSVRLVLTTAGKEGAATSSLYYAKDGEKLEVLVARVIKHDGTIVGVPTSDIQDTEQSGEANIYDPNGRAVKITFAGIAVGDAIELSYKLTRVTPTRPGSFNDEFGFQSREPMLSATYTVDGPAKKPLVAEIYHPERAAKIATTKTTVGDRIHYSWSVKRAAQLVPETAMDFANEVPMLVVTTDPSWQHFSAWWAALTATQMELTPEIKAKVAELTKDKKTDADKIKALYDFVSSDIRYRGLGVGPRTGYTPRKAQETFASRWGVCRDVSILLTTMLRADGFEAYPVLTNVGEPVLGKIAYDGFNHAIVAMPKPGGGWTYLDPTAKNNKELLPGNEAEQSVLVSTTKGEALGTIPALDPKANYGHAIATTTIDRDGSMTSKIKFETRGMFDMVVRGAAAMLSSEQQHELVESVLHAALPDAQLVSYEVSSALLLFNPMTIDLAVKVPRAAIKAGDHYLLRTLVTSGALGLVEAVLPRVFGGVESRKFTLDAQLTFQYDQDETVTLAPGMKVAALPNAASSGNKVSALDASCTQTDATTVTCHRSFSLRSRFIDPSNYASLRGVLGTLGRIAHQPVILAGDKS